MPPPNSPVQPNDVSAPALIPDSSLPTPHFREDDEDIEDDAIRTINYHPFDVKEEFDERFDQIKPFVRPLPSAYIEAPQARFHGPILDTDGQPSQNIDTLRLVHKIDFSALDYLSHVDQNLMCSICRMAFYKPVMARRCLHLFCRSCLDQAIKHNGAVCPIDRRSLELPPDVSSENVAGSFVKAPHAIRNQVDALIVQCPACLDQVVRSEVESHLANECPEALMSCPGKNNVENCQYQILRKDLTARCLHYIGRCDDCGEKVLMIDMRLHKRYDCKERMTSCALCGTEYNKFDAQDHHDECPEIEASCKWVDFGCTHRMVKRSSLQSHEDNCNFRFIGNQIEMLTTQMSHLKVQLKDRQRISDSRIGVLESTTRETEKNVRRFTRAQNEDYATLMGRNPLSGLSEDVDPVVTTSDYHIMSLLERQTNRIDRMEANIHEIEASVRASEARSTTTIFNEIIPIKNEVMELRSSQQTNAMHTRWLMQLRLAENRRRGTTVGSNAGGGGESNNSSPIVPHRSSDSLHQPPRL
ncbi:uncharacterized protein LY89DRAFT_713648 [Mollisia scopiformis]|uniref:Uncharacterized protein n=1 Tax=Mollisia scopiformis TaxID=149040 RepID=A0A194XS49_MOLSC|nr:uncharacterized protein LY89DRAFT_713648 [Mollisia scopiformis]KUJ23125.1 hypothetical protein LY89DRAFT_713648 [Mollisia scopiformis]